MESRLFQDSLQMAEKDFGADTRKICLSCHAPLALESGDLQLVRKASWEGVSCDYCHSVRDVSLEGRNPRASLAIGSNKTGPLKDVTSAAHTSSYSAVHTSSLVCAPCHEYRNALGFPVLTTYSEWSQSSFGKNDTTCQTCHMAEVKGDVVDPHIQRAKTATINLHNMPGSNSLQQLSGAIRAQLTTSRREDTLLVHITVSNESAGHHLPTGSPMRRIELELRADSYKGHRFQAQKVYQRRVADQAGRPLVREHFAFMKGASVISDTRLAPGEQRQETFSFDIPPGVPTKVEATFRYYYSPMARSETQRRVTFLSLSRLVR